MNSMTTILRSYWPLLVFNNIHIIKNPKWQNTEIIFIEVRHKTKYPPLPLLEELAIYS